MFEAQFGQNSQGWVDNPQQTAWLADGVVPAVWAPAGPVRGGRRADRRAAAGRDRRGDLSQAWRTARGGAGLIVRDRAGHARRPEPGWRYYVFECGDRGEWGIWRRDEDHWVDLVPWTASPVVRGGAGGESAQVSAIGPRLIFLINGAQVASLEDNALSSGGVGVYLGGDLNEIAVERFLVQTSQ